MFYFQSFNHSLYNSNLIYINFVKHETDGDCQHRPRYGHLEARQTAGKRLQGPCYVPPD